MRFRYLHIAKFLFQILKPGFSLRAVPITGGGSTAATYFTYLYKICCGICSPLRAPLDDFYKLRARIYMLGACMPISGQVINVLNYWYGSYGKIDIVNKSISVEQYYLYAEDSPARYWYAENTPAVYLYSEGGTIYSPQVSIPSGLFNSSEYPQFIADLNLLMPFYLSYTIIVTNTSTEKS